MENVTTFLFKLDERDKVLLDESARALRQTRSALLRTAIRNVAQQLGIDVETNEGAENASTSA